MSITKTKNGTYRLRIYIPEEVKPYLGISSKMYEKNFKTRKEAKNNELDLLTKIKQIEDGVFHNTTEDILFSDFYKDVWWESYKAG